MTERKETFLIFDANSLIHRAFHALPPLTTPKGKQVNAVYGFFSVFLKVVKEFNPKYIAAAFDVEGPTKRHGQYKEYKGKREKAPDELYSQIPLIKGAIKKIGVPTYEKTGYEADDFIGTLAEHAGKTKEQPEVIIVSGDQDAFQLINEHVKVYTMRKGMQDTVLYDEKSIEQRFDGLKPEQMVDFKALRGDPSDNVPGVAGIGEKTALELLREFGSLEGVYGAISREADSKKIKPRTLKLLQEQREQAMLSRDLVTIERDVPLNFALGDAAWKGMDSLELQKVLQEFGFHSLAKRANGEGRAKESSQASLLEQQSSEEAAMEKIESLYSQGVFSARIYKLEKDLVPVLRAMEEVGIKINAEHFARLAEQCAKELDEFTRQIYAAAGREFNINSSQQLSKVLFEDLEISPRGLKKTPGRVVSTAAAELEKLKHEHPLIPLLLKYRELQKVFTTYIKTLPDLRDENDRIHTEFDQLGAATGRLSSARPNMQNIPIQGEWGGKIREGFVAEQGYELVAFDYSQMELRIAAHITKDETMQEAFTRGEDIHARTAAEVFGVEPGEVTKEMRRKAKALNFGILYGMGARGFSMSSGVSFEEAERFIENYFLRFPRIQLYIDAVKEFTREHGYAETLWGRKRFLPEINSNASQFRASAERMAVNHPIQGTEADIIKQAMVEIYNLIVEKDKKRIRMLLQIHDELLFEISDDIIEESIGPIKKIMEQVISLHVPLEVQAKRGLNWNDLKLVS